VMLVDMELAEVQPVSAQVIVQLASILLGQLQQGRRLPTALHVERGALEQAEARQVNAQGRARLADSRRWSRPRGHRQLTALHATLERTCRLQEVYTRVTVLTALSARTAAHMAATRPVTASHVAVV